MKVSVLVPVYGVEAFIGECAETLFRQTYHDLEYIFVDDCSPDSSISRLKEMLARYPERAGQVTIIRHEVNKGLGAARKTALEAATGDFVFNVDSDDLLPLDAVEQLCHRQEATGADIVDGVFCHLRPDGSIETEAPFQGDKQLMLRLMLLHNTIRHNLSGMLIRRRLFADHHISPEPGVNQSEDFAVTPRLLLCGRRESTTAIVYHYRLNAQSTFRDGMKPHHVKSMLKADELVARFFEANDAEGIYRRALQTGWLGSLSLAAAAGMDAPAMAREYGLLPTLFPIKLCLKLFGHHAKLLRLSYLCLKRGYRTWLSLLPRRSR